MESFTEVSILVEATHFLCTLLVMYEYEKSTKSFKYFENILKIRLMGRGSEGCLWGLKHVTPFIKFDSQNNHLSLKIVSLTPKMI